MRKLSVLENLTRIKRYAGNLTIIEESVSDHVWCMNTLALEFIPILNEKFNTEFDLKDIIYGIALHDIDEALYTDIPRPFKHRNAKIENAIAETVEEILNETLSEEVNAELKRVEDKTTPLGLVIKIFDIAQCGYKMKSEIQLGNKYFINEIENVLEWLEDTLCGLPGFDDFTVQEVQALSWLIRQFIKEFTNEQD